MNAMKKMIAVAAVAAAGFAAFAADEEGAAPTSSDAYSFTYQACLRDDHGNAITNEAGKVQRNQVVTLRLWETATEGGTPLWARQCAVYTDETGLFNLEVSDSVGSPVLPAQTNSLAGAFSKAAAGKLYIGLEVADSAGEIVPRQRLFAVPFASVANDVRAITKDIDVSGNLMFGTAGGNTLKVTKDGIREKGGASEFDEIQVEIIRSKKKENKTTVKVEAHLDVNGNLNVTGNATVSGKLTVGQTPVMNVVVPVGGIIMWTKPNLPDNEHWAICDGGTHNGVTTPDLRGRFIVGVGKGNAEGQTATYGYGNTGGRDFVKLAADELPKHNHTTASPWKHLYRAYNYREAGDDPRYIPFSSMPDNGNYNVGGGDSVTWGDFATKELPHENRPPYYALYYIMRVK